MRVVDDDTPRTLDYGGPDDAGTSASLAWSSVWLGVSCWACIFVARGIAFFPQVDDFAGGAIGLVFWLAAIALSVTGIVYGVNGLMREPGHRTTAMAGIGLGAAPYVVLIGIHLF